jgi:putative membrane protein
VILAPLPLAAGAAALVLYLRGFVRLRRRRPDLAPVGAAVAFAAGVAVALLALSAPLDELADTRLLSAHMAQHLLLGDVAPLLLVLGLRGPLALFVVPPAVLRVLARPHPRRLRETATRPAVALALWAGALYAWHVPALYDAAVAAPALHSLEHAAFLTAGLLVWSIVLDARRSAGGRVGFAACVLLAGMPVAEALIATGPLYPHYAAIADRPLGLTAQTDQARAGLLMMAEQIATLGTAAALLLWSHAELVAAERPAPPA